jgi:simple sugar transport system permease protein
MITLRRNINNIFSEHLIWLILVALCVAGFFVPGFFSTRNVVNIFWASAPLGCTVLGMFMVMLVSGLDLSLESTFGFAPTLATMFMVTWLPDYVTPLVAIFITLLTGILVGLINGLISVKLKVNPFLVTLATMLIMRGIVVYLIPEGVYYLPDGFTFLGKYRIGNVVPFSIIVLLVLYLLGYVITNRLSLGKNIYAIGNNAEAAYVAGIRVERVKIITFMLAGLFASIGGIIEVGRLSAVTADMGEGSIMMVFAATILGGTSMAGGEGKITGIFGAVLVLSIIENLLNLFGVDPSIRQIVYGSILLAAIYLASMQKKIVK